MSIPTRASYSQLLSDTNGNYYQFCILQKDMDKDEAIAYLVFKDLKSFLERNEHSTQREIIDFTQPPLDIEDITFALSRLTSEIEMDGSQSHEANRKLLVFKEDIDAIERLLQQKIELKKGREKADKVITHFVARKVSEFIISKGLFTEANKEKIQALGSNHLALEQLTFLLNLINSSEKIIVSEDEDNRVNGTVNYVLEIPIEEEKSQENQQIENSKVSIASSAFLAINRYLEKLQETASEF